MLKHGQWLYLAKFSLRNLIEMVEPLSDANFIQFETVLRPEEMPGQKEIFTLALRRRFENG